MNFLLRVLNGKSRTLVFAVFVLASASLGADILGFLRDRLLASTFGAGDALDAYYAAFRIPDFIFNFVAVGLLSAGFLPLYSEYAHRSKDEGHYFAQNTLTLIGAALLVLVACAWIGAPLLVPLVAPGFAGPKLTETLAVTRLLLLAPLLFGISGVFSGILQHAHRFLLFAIAPILYNAGIIFGVVFLAPPFGIRGVAMGALLGALLHVGVQMPGVRELGFRFRLELSPMHEGTKRLLKLGIPRTLQLAVMQLTLTGLTAIASSLAAGSIAVLSLADNLQAVPVGVIGISFATAAFPHFSKIAFAGESKRLLGTLVAETLARVIFLAAPAATFFFILRAQIVRVVLGAGAFSWEDTRLTAAVLAMFAFGIVAQALMPVLIRAFFALKDMVTPLLVTVVGAALTVFSAAVSVAVLSGGGQVSISVLRALRVEDLSSATVVAIPFGITVGAIIQVCLLTLALVAGGRLRVGDVVGPAVRIGAAALGAGLVSFIVLRLVAPVLAPQSFVTTLAQGLVAGVAGLTAYFGIARLARFPELPALSEGIRQHFIKSPEPPEAL